MGGFRLTGRDPTGGSPARTGSLPTTRVVAVVNSKGGVGKTTLAANLAVYVRTVDPDLPVLIIGLDEQAGPDPMFATDSEPPANDVSTALRSGRFDAAIRLGRYGVYYVPSSPRLTRLAQPVTDPFVLKQALRRTAFPGVVIIDTRSDFGILTQNAIAASDLTVVPVADQESLLTAKQVFDLLDGWGWPRSRARVLLSMLDERIKYTKGGCRDMLGLLVAGARQLGFPHFQNFVSRSPRVQALATNPQRETLSILYEAGRTKVHDQMGEVAEELFDALEDRRSEQRGDLTLPASNAAPNATPDALDEHFVWLRPRTDEARLALQREGQNVLCVRQFPFFIGRHSPGVLNDFAVPDLRPWQVSRRHAHLIQRNGRIGVVDLGSTLGTWVGDRQLGGPTADPGPAYFDARGGVLILGKRKSRYAFDLKLGGAASAKPAQERICVRPAPERFLEKTAASPVSPLPA